MLGLVLNYGEKRVELIHSLLGQGDRLLHTVVGVRDRRVHAFDIAANRRGHGAEVVGDRRHMSRDGCDLAMQPVEELVHFPMCYSKMPRNASGRRHENHQRDGRDRARDRLYDEDAGR